MTTQPTRGQRTQERIEQVTLALFAEKGVDRTTIGDIARAAGIAEGTIYRHYPSKEELVWQLFSRNYTGLAQQLDALQAERQGLRPKLAAMVGLFCSLFERDPDMFRFLLLVQERWEARRVGKACVSTCRSRWAPSHDNKKPIQQQT